MGKLAAIVLILTGLAGGMIAGTLLRSDQGAPGAATSAADGEAGEADQSAHASAGRTAIPETQEHVAEDHHRDAPGRYDESASERSYVQIGRQVIIPVVDGGRTEALMMFDLALDVPADMSEQVYAAEPRLRDSFLRILFRMSSTGAFSATYTDERVVAELRGELRRAARQLLGQEVAEVLILDLVRQEM